MYGIFTYIYHKNEPNVGKYTSFMDLMGMAVKKNITHQGLVFVAFLQADAVSTFSGSDGLREICDLTGAGGVRNRRMLGDVLVDAVDTIHALKIQD